MKQKLETSTGLQSFLWNVAASSGYLDVFVSFTSLDNQLSLCACVALCLAGVIIINLLIMGLRVLRDQSSSFIFIL